MRIQLGDSVFLVRDSRAVGIVERRSDGQLTIRFPGNGNRREQLPRNELRSLAEAMCEARRQKTKFRNDLSLVGGSTLSQLVAVFGYATKQLRQGSLNKVYRQLQRAGLEIVITLGDGTGRDDQFRLEPRAEQLGPTLDPDPAAVQSPARVPVGLPDPFWPTALGLDANREVAFLRALTGREPLLCLLRVPDDADMQDWLQATWEGMVGWAFRAAQAFRRATYANSSCPEVLIGPATMLQTYLKASVLNDGTPQLRDNPHCLNLISLRKDSDSPVEFLRLQATWPGQIFEFEPQPAPSTSRTDGQLSADVRALLECLFLVAGSQTAPMAAFSPLKTLLWSKEVCAQIYARASVHLGAMLSSGQFRKFKGSNEGATALALKAHLGQWIKKTSPNATLRFEEHQVEQCDDTGDAGTVSRIDLFVEGEGRYEVETLVGSGPMEAFYHQKVFARLKGEDSPLWLVVPNEAVLWAGPYLADLAHYLHSQRGGVLLAGAGEAYFDLKPRLLAEQEIEIDDSGDRLRAASVPGSGRVMERAEDTLQLRDVAGYKDIRARVDELIIWPERHRWALRGASRSSGILFFGPPGCGKSRLARAIAGELDQEVRLLSPSDLRGAYIGWGQILIREQFDWIAEQERRMLVIDELDAVARSRREVGDMHSDEKACVNELLVQLDRVSRLGRLVVGTTNFIDSLDEAVIRSGRFGRFIPVPPPDLEEAVAILSYYLKFLTTSDPLAKHPLVEVPEPAELQAVLESVFADNARESRFFCGADLEEAVNRTYLRCLRNQMSGVPWTDESARIIVRLTPADMDQSLREVPKSVYEESVLQFIRDADRYCGSGIANEFRRRLQVENESEAVS